MDLADFTTRFGPGIRARLDWPRLAGTRPHVHVETLVGDAAKRSLARLFTVWYTDSAGADTPWDTPGSRPLRVATADRTLRTWPDNRRLTVTTLTRAYADGPGPVSLTLPVYRVGEDRHVLLDGNHRAVAAHRADAEVCLTLCSLTGPVRESILPDLRHYAAPSA